MAIVPGTSRSGATIIGGILIGMSRTLAAEYTFYLAVPTMLGASAIKLLKFGLHFTGVEVSVLIIGMVVAFAVSILAIKFLMSYIQGVRLVQDCAGGAGDRAVCGGNIKRLSCVRSRHGL